MNIYNRSCAKQKAKEAINEAFSDMEDTYGDPVWSFISTDMLRSISRFLYSFQSLN